MASVSSNHNNNNNSADHGGPAVQRMRTKDLSEPRALDERLLEVLVTGQEILGPPRVEEALLQGLHVQQLVRLHAIVDLHHRNELIHQFRHSLPKGLRQLLCALWTGTGVQQCSPGLSVRGKEKEGS